MSLEYKKIGKITVHENIFACVMPIWPIIFPILVFEIAVISDSKLETHEVLMDYSSHLRESKRNLGVLLLLFLIGSLFLSNGLEMDLGTTLFASIGIHSLFWGRLGYQLELEIALHLPT